MRAREAVERKCACEGGSGLLGRVEVVRSESWRVERESWCVELESWIVERRDSVELLASG